jgi:hypothetical protein
MATKRPAAGIDHFTVVPENFEPASDEDPTSRDDREHSEE